MNPNSLISLSSFPNPVIHIDADAFFSSVEQALRPELRNRPVVTGKERGIVACASYEAKALGVKRPMRIFEARKICRDLICLPSDYETYSLYSKRMFDIIRRFTPAVEEYSIDEAFAELSGLRRIYRTGYPEITWEIKRTIQKELGITVSVGLSASKTLAKIASRENKPDGFTVIRANELHLFLRRIPLERVAGFGPNTVALLRKKGISNVLDYVLQPESWAQKILGKTGVELWHELRGEMIYPVTSRPREDYLSVSKTKTFTPPSSDKDFVRAQLLRNVESAFIKLRRHKLRASKMVLYLRTQEYRSTGLEVELQHATSSTLEVVPVASQMFERLFSPNMLYRATGVVLSKIESDGAAIQYSLFDDPGKIRSLRAVDGVIDGVNEIYGKHTLHLGATLWLGRHRRIKNDTVPVGRYQQHLTGRGDLPERKLKLLPSETFRRRLNIPLWQVPV
ncbi:MAG: DNA polymerase IV [Candidatus Omnitrophica bacterium]|nr:DNA polymerase IV [Candidatus Omnitrophota bacterium]